MAKGILVEEFHLTVRAPRGLPDARYLAIREALTGKCFRSRLRRAMRRVFGKYPVLGIISVVRAWRITSLTRWIPSRGRSIPWR